MITLDQAANAFAASNRIATGIPPLSIVSFALLDRNNNVVVHALDGTLTLANGALLAGTGLDSKASVRLATAAALDTCVAAGSGSTKTLTITATGTLTVDGVLTALGDRLLIKNQVAGANNGIYTVTTAGATGVSAVLTRAADFDTWDEIPGALLAVEKGDTQADTIFLSTADAGGTLETTAITFTPFVATTAVTIGATTISGGTTTRILYNNGGTTIGEYTISGTGTVVAMATAAALTSATITTKLSPTTDDGAPLGDTTHNFSDLFLASGGVLNYANGNVVLTHTSGVLTLGTGNLIITTAGTAAGSVVTTTGTQTLSGKAVVPVTTNIAGDGAITIASGVVTLSKGSPAAITLAAPSSQNGTRITIVSLTDFQHVITVTGGLWDGTATANVTATFAAVKGASITLVANGTAWYVESLNAVVPAP